MVSIDRFVLASPIVVMGTTRINKQLQSQSNRLPVRLVYDLKETAEAIGVNPDTVRRLIRDGKLGRLPIRHIRVSKVELDRFLAAGICGRNS